MAVTVVDPNAKKLKILSATFVENAHSETATILIAYGTNVKIVFERVVSSPVNVFQYDIFTCEPSAEFGRSRHATSCSDSERSHEDRSRDGWNHDKGWLPFIYINIKCRLCNHFLSMYLGGDLAAKLRMNVEMVIIGAATK